MDKLGHLINEEEYFDLIYRKTACLFKVSMQLGAVRGRAVHVLTAEALKASHLKSSPSANTAATWDSPFRSWTMYWILDLTNRRRRPRET